jgi:hypothetical protein
LFRTWTNQEHVSTKHIPQLGQLVQVSAPKEGSSGHHASVFDISKHRAGLVGHGSDLQNPKGGPLTANAVLSKEEWAWHAASQPNHSNAQQHERRRNQENSGKDPLRALRQTLTQSDFRCG